MKKAKNKSLENIYSFMADTYQGNWQYRWGGVPWMRKNIKAGKKESILAHQWACVGFWFLLKDVCPSLSALVDTTEIYERVWSHDLGETFLGDISQFRQLRGVGKDKHIAEFKEVQKISKNLSAKTHKRLLQYIDGYGHNIEKIKKLEILVARLIDTMQGNHFALVFGDGLLKNAATIDKIVGRTFVRVCNQLLKVLKQNNYNKAYREILDLRTHHLKYYKKLGIKINL